MKGVYSALLLACGILLLYSEVRESILADDSHQLVGGTDESEGKKQNARIPNWVPQPSDIAHVEEQRLLAAVKTAQKALIEAPKDTTAWGQLGNVYFVHGWEAEAAQCYRSAIEIAPTEFHWLYYLGLITYKVDPQAAAQTLAEAIKLDPHYAPAHIYRAAALRSLGHLEQAKTHLETANALDPQNPYASLWLGELALATQQFEVAQIHLQRALKLNPEQSEAHAALAQVAKNPRRNGCRLPARASITDTDEIYTDARSTVVECAETRCNSTTLCRTWEPIPPTRGLQARRQRVSDSGIRVRSGSAPLAQLRNSTPAQ